MLECGGCGKTYNDDFSGWRCECGRSLWLRREVSFSKSSVRTGDFSMWRYAAAYPIAADDVRVTLGEGMTPLTRAEFYGRQILVKNDGLMPTGSFKDRGVAMVVNGLLQRGVRAVAEDSSGNAGSSFAAYCAQAGLAYDLYVPAGTSSGKVTQARLLGAVVHEVEGTRDQVALAAQAETGGGAYGGHNWHPLFVEGVKSLAYELWEQNDFAAPGAVVCPVGNGSIVAGVHQGFSELLRNGEVTALPRILGVQAENCNTTYREFKGLSVDYEVKKTIAEGISLYRPSKYKEAAAMIHASGGDMFSVSEEEILEAARLTARKGFLVEPTSAAAFAGLRQAVERGLIDSNAATVVVVSGNGLKTMTALEQEILST